MTCDPVVGGCAAVAVVVGGGCGNHGQSVPRKQENKQEVSFRSKKESEVKQS